MSWLTLNSLAQALGVSRQALHKRQATEHWPTRLVPGRGRGGKTIEVDASGLPSDIIAKLAQNKDSGASSNNNYDLTAFDRATPEQQTRALAKLRLLNLAQKATSDSKPRLKALDTYLEKYNRGLVDLEVLQTLGPVSCVRTLTNWEKAHKIQGLAGLLEKRGRRRGSASVSRPMQKFIFDAIIARPKIRAASIYRMLPAEFPGQPLPSQRTIRNLAAKIKKDNAERLLMLHQPSVHKRHYQISLGRADADLTEPNQRWEADSTRADILARKGGTVMDIITKGGKRHTLIAFMDVFSRRPVFLLEEKGGGYNINLALLKAVRRLGVPDEIIFDRGKDYQSRAVQAFCADLGINTPEIPGYSPELKPHVERLFDTIQSQLFALLDGYVANKVDNRSEITLAKYTRERLQQEIDLWVDAHERTVHSSTGQTPLERGNPEGWTRRTVPEDQLRILLNPPVERSIRQGRIRHNGGYYYSPELKYLDAASRVLVREDPDDAGILHVFDPDMEYLCLAEDMRRLGLTPAQISEERRAYNAVRAADRKSARETAKALNIAEINRRALRLEIENSPEVAEAPVEEISLPGIEDAVETKSELASIDQPEAEQSTERPVFDDLVDRYEWIMAQLAKGLEISEQDRAAADEFEGSRLYRLNGGEAYKQKLLGQRAAVAWAVNE